MANQGPYSPRSRPPSLNPPPPDLSIDPGSHRSNLFASRGSPSPVQSSHGHHRASWSQDLRGIPASPHRNRHPSMSQQAIQELLSNPPIPHKSENNPFAGRDWKGITVGEIVDPEEVRWVEETTSVEEATNSLTKGAPNVVLIRSDTKSREALGTFDYSDLNAYLLLVVGLARPDVTHLESFNELAKKGREGKVIPVKDIKDIGRREPVVVLPHNSKLTHAVEIFGSGVHRILIAREGTQDVYGILTQLRLVRFFWENGRNFPQIDRIFPSSLMDLRLGSKAVRAINGDKPLTDALELMNNESITSLPVLDNERNVVGNISHVDVRLLTKTTSLPLLQSSCIHFISVILSERGMNDGKDSFPVFYVSPYSTLAQTVAKLTATRSHRMWIVDQPSPHASAPPTPTHVPTATAPTGTSPPTHGPPYTPASGGAVPASSLPGQHMSGRLSGVISLTDVLNVFARASGLSPHDPDEARRQRRGSSSSSVRASMDSARSSSVDLTRSQSDLQEQRLPRR